MTARFQIIHFEPDPFSGSRFAVGALVESEQRVELVTGWLPNAEWVGGDQASAVVRMVLSRSRRATRLGELPMSVGPQVQLGLIQRVPEGVANPAAWVKDHVLPRSTKEDERSWPKSAGTLKTTSFAALPEILQKVDLAAAVLEASKSNDLLPPRVDDDVDEESGIQFADSLFQQIESGKYAPDRAYLVHVPKPGYGTRPAALLTLADRTVYHALVSRLRTRIEKQLLGADVVMWPRGTRSFKRWTDFERSPLMPGVTHVVLVDVAGYYDQIPHAELGELLGEVGGRRSSIDTLVEFLDRIMGSPRGLPQGLDASDALATAYLTRVDAALAREGYHFARHGDDYRIAGRGYSHARAALFLAETELRRCGLMLNGSKSHPIRRATYERDVGAPRELLEATTETLVDTRLKELSSSGDELEAALKAAGLDEVGWALFYHETATLDEAIQALRPSITPDKGEIAARLFREILKRTPEKEGGLSSDVFHQVMVPALIRLSAARQASEVDRIGELLIKFPDKTEALVAYLLSVKDIANQDVVDQIKKALAAPMFRTGWELAWLVRALVECGSNADGATVEKIRGIASDEKGDWMSRIEAIRFLLQRGELDNVVLRGLYALCPAPFRADLAAAVYSMLKRPSWARDFVARASQEPVNALILRRLGAEALSSSPSDF